MNQNTVTDIAVESMSDRAVPADLPPGPLQAGSESVQY